MPYKDLKVRKEKQAGYSKSYYEKNKKEVMQKINARKKTHKEWFTTFKSTLKCTVCGEDRPATLDFHHVTPTNTNKKVHKLVSDGHTKTRILEEIEKCIVLCSNCHRIHHHEERELKKNKKTCKQAKIE
jgi:hypothetical protein